MDTENKRSTQSPAAQSPASHAPQSGASASPTASSSASSTASTAGGQGTQQASAGTEGWLATLRKPGISFRYSFDKQHIPDMNAAGAGGSNASGSGASGKSSGGSNSGGSGASGSSQSGSSQSGSGAGGSQTTDTMHCSGTYTARYFDLIAGVGAIMAVCGLLKLGMGCCRCAKRKMF